GGYCMRYELFKTALKRHGRTGLTHPNEQCPDSETLINYVQGKLDAETADHVRVHIAFCKQCFLDVQILEELKVPAGWKRLIDKLRECVVERGKNYGPGALVGAFRFPAKHSLRVATSKVVDTSVGDNT